MSWGKKVDYNAKLDEKFGMAWRPANYSTQPAQPQPVWESPPKSSYAYATPKQEIWEQAAAAPSFDPYTVQQREADPYASVRQAYSTYPETAARAAPAPVASSRYYEPVAQPRYADPYARPPLERFEAAPRYGAPPTFYDGPRRNYEAPRYAPYGNFSSADRRQRGGQPKNQNGRPAGNRPPVGRQPPQGGQQQQRRSNVKGQQQQQQPSKPKGGRPLNKPADKPAEKNEKNGQKKPQPQQQQPKIVIQSSDDPKEFIEKNSEVGDARLRQVRFKIFRMLATLNLSFVTFTEQAGTFSMRGNIKAKVALTDFFPQVFFAEASGNEQEKVHYQCGVALVLKLFNMGLLPKESIFNFYQKKAHYKHDLFTRGRAAFNVLVEQIKKHEFTEDFKTGKVDDAEQKARLDECIAAAAEIVKNQDYPGSGKPGQEAAAAVAGDEKADEGETEQNGANAESSAVGEKGDVPEVKQEEAANELQCTDEA